MRIGIDISQIVHEGTGVAIYVRKLVAELLKIDTKNEYVLFGASLRKRGVFYKYFPRKNLVIVPIPPTLLDILWNKLHIIPVEWFIGSVDVFWSSDWTQPPLAHAKGMTTIHDLSFLRYPESFVTKIIETQKRRLELAIKECKMFLCDSEITKKDAMEFLDIPKEKLAVIYPGI